MYDVFYSGSAPGLFAFERPAISIQDAARQSRTEYFWYIHGLNDYTDFKFTIKPVPWESTHTYVWGDQWQRDAGVYLVPVAHADNPIWNFRTDQHVRRLPSRDNWIVPANLDVESFDFSWHPDPHEPPYNYHVPSQWQRASGLIYAVPGATGTKFLTDIRVTALPDKSRWTIPSYIDSTLFDFSWHPDVTDVAARWHFPSQWQRCCGLIYECADAICDKFTCDQVAHALPNTTLWDIPDTVESFDYSWHPDTQEPAYDHVFPSVWHSEGGPVYRSPGATATKYHAEPRATLKADRTNWNTIYDCEFDYSWRPHPKAPPYIYVFGNQWHHATKMPTLEYNVPGAQDRFYVDEPVARLPPTTANWRTLIECDFDYSWQPDPGDPAYIYVFGNQWWPAEKMPTVEYHVPGATERKYLEEPRAQLRADRTRWTVPEELDDSKIDFSWVPDPGDPPYEYHWSDQYQVNTGLIYTVPGSKHIKILDELPLIGQAENANRTVDIFFVDRYNRLSDRRWKSLQERYPGAQRVRYMNSMMDTIKRCAARSSTTRFWVVSSLLDYTDFDFDWHPDTWQANMTHVFGTAWQKWSDTYLINKHEFNRVSRWAKSLTEFPNLNFVSKQKVSNSLDNCDVYYIDHHNGNLSELERLRSQFPDLKVTRFVDNYLDTFKRIMSSTDKEYVWVTSSLCSYDRFDFSWHPEPWQADMLHVFPSNHQKQGDTFYIPVAKFKDNMADLEILDWFNTINYCQDQSVVRIMPDHVVYTGDNIVEAIRQHRFTQPYALFSPDDLAEFITPSIWRKKDRSVHVLSRGGSVLMVPRDAQAEINTQVYDYPYIQRSNIQQYERPLDVIYISNGEPDAERWFRYLCAVTDRPVKRVQNVNGRVAAYQAAALASETPWFFAVFAKLEVDLGFDWDWQPDYLQGPKHYIFNARNPVNGLEYGHMAMIAYNRNLVLNNEEEGLDFTLRQPHASVPVLSGVAHYNQDAWTTWRTAFREVIKLQYFQEHSPTVENEYRLKTWLTVASGNYSDYSIRGALDAVQYYQSVNGELSKLMLSFDWAWLRDYFNTQNKSV